MPKGDGKRSLETGMLSFARSLQPSEGLFWGRRSADETWREPIEVREKGVRGQSSEYNTPNPGRSNPQVVEVATVPLGCDGIELSFTMWVANFAKKPWACDKPQVNEAYRELVAAYEEKGGFRFLAGRFLWNIANARFAWRNRYLADEMRVSVACGDAEPLIFDPTRLDLDEPASREALCAAVPSNEPAIGARVDSVVDWITAGLTHEQPRFLRVAWYAKMQEAQEVFPSQEYLREDERKNAPSRVYAKLPQQRSGGRIIMQASMHSQKIGAALRHIDDWHSDAGHTTIAVNPYGGVQETGAVLRDKNEGQSFYDLRKKPEKLFEAIEAASDGGGLPPEVHFFVANLVRGGVFGQKEAG